MKETTFGSMDVCDAHVHFFSHQFFGKLAGLAPTTREAMNPVAAACVTGASRRSLRKAPKARKNLSPRRKPWEFR